MKFARKQIIVGVLLLLIGAGSIFAYQQWLSNQRLPEGLIQANGRIEGDHVTVSSKFPGRVLQLVVREGASVQAGELMVQLDDIQTRAQVAQARKAWQAVEARVQATHTDLAVLNLEVPLTIGRADAAVAEARAMHQRAIAMEREARSDAERYRRLAAHDNASRQQLEQAETRWDVARNDIAAARSALNQAIKRSAEAELGWKRIRAKEAEVAALEHQRDQAEAALEEVESVLADLTIRAPSTGVVMTRMVDVGEFVKQGAPMFEIVDLDHLYLKVYVPEAQIGKVRMGLPARIYTDAFPDSPFNATVRYIASQAEFTPKEVQTPEERVKLTYAVRLYLDENPEHRLTPGLPADAVIRWKESAKWAKPQW